MKKKHRVREETKGEVIQWESYQYDMKTTVSGIKCMCNILVVTTKSNI